MPVVNVNDVQLNYRELGNPDKRTIIFAPTILWGVQAFDYLVPEFADDFHIIMVDIHGHGKSGYRLQMTLENIADDFAQLLDRLDLSNVSWVGHSIGGMIGMRLALAHPETINSLVLIATTARLDPPPLREQTWQLWKMFGDGHREDIADAAIEFLFAPATYEKQPKLIEQYRNRLVSFQNVEGIIEAARSVFDRIDIGGKIDSIKIPTLAIAGKDDMATPPTETDFIASRISHAQSVIIEEAGHLLVVEKPQEVSQVIRKFLAENNCF
jgi:3-oxoadipate enol-lactonase